jgi:hypothetical protein
MIVLTTGQVADVLRRELNAHGSRNRGRRSRLVQFDAKNHANTVWGDPASPAPSPSVINWLDFWYELDQCGRDDWPQLIRVPAFLLDRRHHDAGTDSGIYTREEVAVMLREAANHPDPERTGDLPFVTLEPVEDGVYRIAEEFADEPAQPEPDDDVASIFDDNRQVVFLDSRMLFHSA